MPLLNNIFFACLIITYSGLAGAQNKDSDSVEVLILGTLHFNQFHKAGDEHRDFLDIKKQSEFEEVVSLLETFNPDAVLIEREPSMQNSLDSLYKLPLNDLNNAPDGRSEVYQIGFRLAKELNLETVYGIDYYESIPQNLLKSGKNIEKFNNALREFQSVGRGITQKFLKGELTINEFLIELNRPDKITMSHQLFYNTPAYVQNGSFSKMEDLGNDIDTTQIGAEYISLFYERNLKIYANIINQQLEIGAKRMVIIIGQVHVGVLKDIIKNNPNYQVAATNQYLNKQQ